MLSKENRLNLASAKWRFKNFDLDFSTSFYKILIKKNSLEVSRFGFLFSSKIGKATQRNKFRRLLTECVYNRLEKFPKGFDFIFIAYPNIARADYEKIGTSLDQILPKIPLS